MVVELNLIRKMAWSFTKSTEFDYTELFAEAALGYCEAIKSFVPGSDARFNTHAYHVMYSKLSNFIWRERIQERVKRRVSYEKRVSYQPVGFDEFLGDMPKDCQELVRIILDHVDEIPDELAPKYARGKIVEILRDTGWSWPRIWDSIRKLKVILN